MDEMCLKKPVKPTCMCLVLKKGGTVFKTLELMKQGYLTFPKYALWLGMHNNG